MLGDSICWFSSGISVCKNNKSYTISGLKKKCKSVVLSDFGIVTIWYLVVLSDFGIFTIRYFMVLSAFAIGTIWYLMVLSGLVWVIFGIF